LSERDQKVQIKVADKMRTVLQYFTMTSNSVIHVRSNASLAYKRSH
jgi:hypothetical protein